MFKDTCVLQLSALGYYICLAKLYILHTGHLGGTCPFVRLFLLNSHMGSEAPELLRKLNNEDYNLKCLLDEGVTDLFVPGPWPPGRLSARVDGKAASRRPKHPGRVSALNH